MDRADTLSELENLHLEINSCRICERLVTTLHKPTSMVRGGISSIMVVGISPGNKEVAVGRAFAGQSGKKLDEWLVRSGASPAEPRRDIYFTSVLKCKEPAGKFALMARQCRHFLRRQIAILKPRLVITLGKQPYDELRLSEQNFSQALCELQSTRGLLVNQLGYDYLLLPWPHPSGLNRQLNDPIVQEKLESSFAAVRQTLKINEL